MTKFFRWDDGPIELLKAGYARGDSFSVICADIVKAYPANGPLTRCSVAGRAKRDGLNGRVAPGMVEQMTAYQRQAKERRQAAKSAPRKVPPHPFVPQRKPIAEQVAEIVFLAPAGGLSFLEQRDGYCRFPITVETDFENFRVCGCLCKMTQPYCDEHTAKAYQPPRQRPPRDPAPMRRNTSEMFFKDRV